MSVEISGGTAQIPGGAELGRFAHFRARVALGGQWTVYPASGLATVPNAIGAFAVLGNAPTFPGIVDQRRVVQIRPSLVAGQGYVWKGSTGGAASEQYARMIETDPVISGQPLVATERYAMVCQAWLRKFNNVDAVWARQWFGFMSSNLTPNAQSAIDPVVGIFGDGGVGFRLGSVDCPDGAAAGQKGSNAADAGTIQPTELINPGLNWFHVRVKMSPALGDPASGGRLPGVAIYLNGTKRVEFHTNVNFPRGWSGANQNYGQIEASIFADFAAAPQMNGWFFTDFETWYDTDLSL